MLKPSLKILKYPDPILTSPCSEVEDIDWELRKTFKEMYKLLKKKQGWAVAANQVGIPLRFFVFDFGTGMHVAINPEIEPFDLPDDQPNEFMYREGCLSVPGLFWSFTRPDMVKVSYWDENEEYIEGVVGEIEGRVFQHEIDHLNGKMLFDAMPEEQQLEARSQAYSRDVPATVKGTRLSEYIKG